jgi:hypothetical protein
MNAIAPPEPIPTRMTKTHSILLVSTYVHGFRDVIHAGYVIHPFNQQDQKDKYRTKNKHLALDVLCGMSASEPYRSHNWVRRAW